MKLSTTLGTSGYFLVVSIYRYIGLYVSYIELRWTESDDDMAISDVSVMYSRGSIGGHV